MTNSQRLTGRSRFTLLWLCALTLIGVVALSQRPPETAALPDLPLIVLDESQSMPTNARIATPEAAAELGLELVQLWTGAENPRVVKVELLPFSSSGGSGSSLDIAPGVDPLPDPYPASPAWRVTFDSAQFGIRCPPTPPGSTHPCPPGNRASVAFFASNGDMISLAVGRPGDIWE